MIGRLFAETGIHLCTAWRWFENAQQLWPTTIVVVPILFLRKWRSRRKKNGCLNANICGPQTDRKPRWLMIWCRISPSKIESNNDIFPHDHACWTPRAESNGLAWDWRGVWLKNWGPKEAQLPTELTNTQWYHFEEVPNRWKTHMRRMQLAPFVNHFEDHFLGPQQTAPSRADTKLTMDTRPMLP